MSDAPAASAPATRPIIGINTTAMGGSAPHDPPLLATRANYIDSVLRASGLPIQLPSITPDSSLTSNSSAPSAPPRDPNSPSVADIAAQQADLCAGFIFIGGPDINPARYGCEVVHPTVSTLTDRREHYDFALIRAVLAARKPFLAICLGCQEVNVALGGTLIQDIYSAIPTTTQHTQKHAPYFTRHEVDIEPDSQLARLMGGTRLLANSAHHQAVDQPGQGLRIVARSTTDGIIEALEMENHPFGLLIQWHPECLTHEEAPHAGIFKGLIEAARGVVPR